MRQLQHTRASRRSVGSGVSDSLLRLRRSTRWDRRDPAGRRVGRRSLGGRSLAGTDGLRVNTGGGRGDRRAPGSLGASSSELESTAKGRARQSEQNESCFDHDVCITSGRVGGMSKGSSY